MNNLKKYYDYGFGDAGGSIENKEVGNDFSSCNKAIFEQPHEHENQRFFSPIETIEDLKWWVEEYHRRTFLKQRMYGSLSNPKYNPSARNEHYKQCEAISKILRKIELLTSNTKPNNNEQRNK